jgi:hypothetical protein
MEAISWVAQALDRGFVAKDYFAPGLAEHTDAKFVGLRRIHECRQ